jgi:Predicted Zn-dependent protease
MFFSLYNNFTFLIIIPGIIISIWAQSRIRRTYETFAKIPGNNGVAANEFVSVMLRQNGVNDVEIGRVRGSLTDHYDPRKKAIFLSEGVYGSSSIAAIAIAAHEAGHALQYAKGYTPVKIRGALVPVVSVISSLAFPLIIFGAIMRYTPLVSFAAYAFLAICIFQVATLPVEFNASHRALANIYASHALSDAELTGAKKVLNAAAMTYLAALLVTFLQFVGFSAMSRRN